jgi:hypothetical protein
MISATANLPEDLPDSPRIDEAASTSLFQKLGALVITSAIVMLVGWATDDSPGKRQFYFSYLFGWFWALSLSLGALFWVLIHHLTAAGWSVVIRRIYENITRMIPVLLLLFIPILIGMDTIYKWTNASESELPHGKGIWLSKPFFVVRILIYFTIWIGYSHFFRRQSIRMDGTSGFEDRKALLRKCEWWAPSGILLLGLTATFAAFDLVMSLNYAWFSTIFGVIFWADSIRGSICLCVLTILVLHYAGYMRHTIKREHFHDMGKLMFGFVVFWTYVSFAQYFLYWYGNIPEETVFYNDRREASWYTLSKLLPICYFAVPFILLMPRGNKRNPKTIGFVAAWVMLFQALHLYWEIMPEGLKSSIHDRPEKGVSIHWLDIASLTLFGSIMASCMLWGFRNYPIIPVRDPRLAESIKHQVDEFGDVQE